MRQEDYWRLMRDHLKKKIKARLSCLPTDPACKFKASSLPAQPWDLAWLWPGTGNDMKDKSGYNGAQMSVCVTILSPKIQGFSNCLLIIGDFKSSFGNQKRQDKVTVLSKTPVQKKSVSEHQNHERCPHRPPFT